MGAPAGLRVVCTPAAAAESDVHSEGRNRGRPLACGDFSRILLLHYLVLGSSTNELCLRACVSAVGCCPDSATRSYAGARNPKCVLHTLSAVVCSTHDSRQYVAVEIARSSVIQKHVSSTLPHTHGSIRCNVGTIKSPMAAAFPVALVRILAG